MQRALRDVGDAHAGGIQARIIDPARRLQLASATGQEIGHEQPAVQGERRGAQISIASVGDDPAGRLAGSLAPRSLRIGELRPIGRAVRSSRGSATSRSSPRATSRTHSA